MDETTSRHLRNASEVLLWIPIKNQFAHSDEQIVSYASRLSSLLQVVFELRRDSTERRGIDTVGPVERLQIVYNVQWTVLDEERRLLVAASFDRSWETYFRELADTTGSLLDAIFCHCEGFEKNTCADDFDTFMSWIRKYQRPCDFFFAAAPDLTTDDLRYLKLLSRVAEPGLLSADTVASRIGLKPPAETAPRAEAESIEKALWSLFELRKLFTDDVVLGAEPPKLEQTKGEPKKEQAKPEQTPAVTLELLRQLLDSTKKTAKKGRTERAIFDGAMSALFLNEAKGLQEANERLELQLETALQLELRRKREDRSLAVFARCADLTELLSWSRTLAAPEPARKSKLVAAAQEPDVVLLQAEELNQIQAGILTDYPGTSHGVMALIQCDSPGSFRAFLEYMHPRVTSELARLEHDATKAAALSVNLGLTYHGLERLGLPESTLLQFPKEFREGMEARAGLLGDVGDPDYPLETGPVAKGRDAAPRVRMSTVDAVVWMQTTRRELGNDTLDWWTDLEKNPFRETLDALEAIQTADGLKGVRVISEQPLQRQFAGNATREHFGFVDAGKIGSQPVPRVVYADDQHRSSGPAYENAASRDNIRLGEILLGYKNQRGEDTRTATVTVKDGTPQELLKNGSFLVVRKLRQNVGMFRDFVASTSTRLGVEPATLKGLIAGRAPDGAPLVACGPKNQNDFTFDLDPDGVSCPHFSHIRRTNPRTRGEAAVVPRILRRGFAYGPSCPERVDETRARGEEAMDRGLVFMGYNTNIAEQFEVIQRWINGGNRTGMLSTQQDLLAGQGPISQAGYWHRGANSSLDKQFGPPAKPLVSLHWGAYLFVPSRSAVAALKQPLRSDLSAAAERGEEIIRRLLSFECERARASKLRAAPVDGQERAGAVPPIAAGAELPPERAVWKKVLEEAGGTDALDVWQAVRLKHNGALRTAYGVLVANRELAQTVLRDDGRKYSVKVYAERLRSLVGNHYLGIDRHDATYATRARDPNDYVYKRIFPDDAFALARKYALAALREVPASRARRETRVRRLAEIVVLQLCNTWFGLPLDDERLNALVFTSRYAFQVAPGHWLEDKLEKRQETISKALGVSLFQKHLRGHTYEIKDEQENAVDVALNGAMVGFAAPAIASIITILDAWSADGTLWRLAEIVRSGQPANAVGEQTAAAAVSSLLTPTIEALARKPVPSLLYRTAEQAAVGPIASGHEVTIKAGDTVIVGLGAVYEDARSLEPEPDKPEQWLFGGEYTAANEPAREAGTPTSHGCPARNAALAVFLGVFSAVLSQPDLRLPRRFVVSYAETRGA